MTVVRASYLEEYRYDDIHANASPHTAALRSRSRWCSLLLLHKLEVRQTCDLPYLSDRACHDWVSLLNDLRT